MKNRTEIFGDATLYLGDCLEVMADMEAGNVDAVVTDPPYGIGWKAPKPRPRSDHSAIRQVARGQLYGQQFDEIYGDDRPFDPTPALLGRHQVIWGAHVFYDRLPAGGGLLVWDKTCGVVHGLGFGDAECAWKSWGGAVRVHRQRWTGFVKAGRERIGAHNQKALHPNEKPVLLLEWCIEQVPQPAATILDPFMGSGTTGVACMNLGRKFIGIEIEPKYFDIACRRIDLAARQERIDLPETEKPKQETMDGVE